MLSAGRVCGMAPAGGVQGMRGDGDKRVSMLPSRSRTSTDLFVSAPPSSLRHIYGGIGISFAPYR